MRMNTSLTLINGMTDTVEFFIQQGPSEFTSVTVSAGQTVQHETDPPAGKWAVYAKFKGMFTSPPEWTDDPNATFQCSVDPKTGLPVVTIPPSDQDPGPLGAAGGPPEAQHLLAMHAEGDLDGLDRAAARLSADFPARPDPSRVAAVRYLCHLVGDYDHDDWPRQQRILDGLAGAALRASEHLTEEEELELLCRLGGTPSSLGGAAWLAERARRAGLWLRAWQRIRGAMDPGFDPADRPALAVPAPGGLPAGVAPEAIPDRRARADYQASLRQNAEKARAYRRQAGLRRLAARAWPLLEGYLAREAATPHFDLGGVREAIAAQLTHPADAAPRQRLLAALEGVVSAGRAGLVASVLPPVRVVVSPLEGKAPRAHLGAGQWVRLSIQAPLGFDPAHLGELRWYLAHRSRGTSARLVQTDVGSALLRVGSPAVPASLQLRAVRGPHKGKLIAEAELVGATPTGAVMARAPNTGLRHQNGTWSVGFQGTITLTPDADYEGLLFREGTVQAVATGWLAGWNGLVHAIGQTHDVDGAEVNCIDSVFSGEKDPDADPPPYANGDFNWAIPWQCSEDGGTTWVTFTTANHHATSDANGRAAIEKAGAGPYTRVPADPTSAYLAAPRPEARRERASDGAGEPPSTGG